MRTETLFCSELDPKHVAWLQSHNWHRVSAQEVFLKWKSNEWTTTKKPRPNLPLIWCERKSSLTTGGLSGWNTKTVRYPIMFKLAVHQGSWFGTDDTASVGYYIRRSIYKEETGIMWDGNTWFFKSEGIHCLQKFHCQKQVLLKQNCMTLSVRSFSHMATLLLFQGHKSNLINKMKTFIERQYRGVVKSTGSGTNCLHSNPSLAWPWQGI